MTARDAVERWIYSGGDELAPETFRQGLNDRQLAEQLAADWPSWSEGKCPHAIAAMTLAFAEFRAEFEE